MEDSNGQLNYHIAVDKMNYSVPYEYVGKRVELESTKSYIDVYYKASLVCSHKGCMEERISIPQTLTICRKIINCSPGMENVSKDGQLKSVPIHISGHRITVESIQGGRTGLQRMSFAVETF